MKKIAWMTGLISIMAISNALAQNLNTQTRPSNMRYDPNVMHIDRYEDKTNVNDTIGRAVERGRQQIELLQYNMVPNVFDRRPPANSSNAESQYPANNSNSNLNNSNIYKPAPAKQVIKNIFEQWRSDCACFPLCLENEVQNDHLFQP